MLKTYHITIEGKVQGVGFRPFVFQTAQKLNLKGWVNNGNEGVKIEVSGEKEVLNIFLEKLYAEKPEIACITKFSYQIIDYQPFAEFSIRHSENIGQKKLLLTADLDTCPACLAEFYNPESRFFQYPFVACTHCGTRYSIIEKLPYDRENTVMRNFEFCQNCQTEYNNPLDRRFYTQNHSCSSCGIIMQLYNAENQLLSENQMALEQTANFLLSGKIVAIKGIGGFLLLADATQPSILQQLRQKKHRPTKPFALMYPDEQTVEKDVFLTTIEKQLLLSREKPIVLLQVRDKPVTPLALENIAPEIEPKKLGIMLPYTAFLDFILKKVQKPIVATSANLSHFPIIFENTQALQELSTIADYILLHNRNIVVPQDDSVIRFSSKFEQKIILRRSRSLAPNYIFSTQNEKLNLQKITTNVLLQKIKSKKKKLNFLALGAELKSSFTLLHAENIYTSQYLGDLQSFEAQENFRKTLLHFLQLFDAKPEKIITDKHKNYFTTQLAEELSTLWKVSHQKIQHHEAHFWAVLAENNLLTEKVLGIIWDGTGVGNDEQIWGGEFFEYQSSIMQRIAHFEYFPHILGDKMPKEPRISALAILSDVPEFKTFLQPKFTKNEWKIYEKYLQNKEKITLKNASVGRIFDAFASILGLADVQTFEGEAAMKVEALAQRFYIQRPDYQEYYEPNLSIKMVFKQVLQDIFSRKDKGEIAFKFHLTLVKIIQKIAQEKGYTKIAFSGGVWQNALLVDIAHEQLYNFELYFHQQLSPNDENISFGQLVSAIINV